MPDICKTINHDPAPEVTRAERKRTMKYGERFETTCKDWITGKTFKRMATYRYVSWGDYHTDNEGEGLWIGDKQIEGTCQFSVCGCKTEKAAKAKIRKYAMR